MRPRPLFYVSRILLDQLQQQIRSRLLSTQPISQRAPKERKDSDLRVIRCAVDKVIRLMRIGHRCFDRFLGAV